MQFHRSPPGVRQHNLYLPWLQFKVLQPGGVICPAQLREASNPEAERSQPLQQKTERFPGVALGSLCLTEYGYER